MSRRATIISIGTELLMGEITNTNTVFLSRRLNDHGVDVLHHHTVGDNPGRLTRVLQEAMADCDLIITTGGLGPTQDDLTKEVVCRVFGDELVMNEEWLALLYDRYAKWGRVMTDNNRKQALLPSRAQILWNEKGSAPGFILQSKPACRKDTAGKVFSSAACGTKGVAAAGHAGNPDADTAHEVIVCCLPGPPREMTWLFEEKAEPLLFTGEEEVLVHRMLRTFGIGESSLETELLDLIDGQTDPTIATYAKIGETALRIASKRKTAEEAEAAVEEMIRKVQERVGEYVYSTEDKELVQVAGRMLMERNLTISAAESCTGGLFGATLTEIPGISAVFDRSLVTYSNRAKREELGVREETLEQFGAVSEETAREMAEGVRRVSGTDIGISVTGIAGPDGGTEDKPVGLVWMAFASGEKTVCRKITWNTRSRNTNRQYAVLNMLDLIRRNV